MRFLLLALVLSGAWLAQAADLKIPIERYSLPNGMRVVLSRDNAVPVVSVYVIYGVGARSETKGRSGFAHLFEHMMFEGSANAPKGMLDKLIEGNGGVENGSTHPDFTDYFEMLPSNKLATALWLEADRMRSLAITEENLANQKEAVKQERRLSFDNRPYATAISDTWPQLIYRNWQNAHSIIGSFEDLNAATIADVRNFFKTYYAPNNAVLAVVGDIEPSQVKHTIAEYFGDIPSQPQPKPPDLTEPKPEARSEVYRDKLARVPAVVIGYPGPVRRSPDYYALYMLDAVLTLGDSSRFELDLVKGKESVVQYEANLGWPYAGPNDYKDPQDYGIFILHKPNFTGKQIVGQVQEEIAAIQKDGVSQKELDRVRTLTRATRISGLQSTLERARVLGQYELLDHHPDFINTEMDKMMAVTPDEIRDAARKYLAPERRSVLEIVPAPLPKEAQ